MVVRVRAAADIGVGCYSDGGDQVLLLQLMFMAILVVISAVGAAVLFVVLLAFMPARRARVLASTSVASAMLGGGAGVFLMALFVDDTLDSQAEFVVYLGGIAALAIVMASSLTWLAAKMVK